MAGLSASAVYVATLGIAALIECGDGVSGGYWVPFPVKIKRLRNAIE